MKYIQSPRTIFTPNFPFFDELIPEKQGKLWEFMLQVVMPEVPKCHLSFDFPFFFPKWILEDRGKFLEFIPQVEYNLRCHVKSFLIFLFLMNQF